MTCEERERTNWLCMRIQEEQDPKKFNDLIWQLDALLAVIDKGRARRLLQARLVQRTSGEYTWS